MTGKLTIRQEQESDYRAVEELTREAFWNLNAPGCCEHALLHKLREHEDFLRELDLVAELDGVLAGHIAYSRAWIEREDNSRFEVLCFGPVSVRPDVQGKGVGSALIKHSLRLAKQAGYRAVCILGDPRYYSRFGFHCGERYDIRMADGLYAVPLQVLELRSGAMSGVAGRFIESAGFEISQEETEQFDRTFPPKKKEERASQQVFQLLSSLIYPVGNFLAEDS